MAGIVQVGGFTISMTNPVAFPALGGPATINIDPRCIKLEGEFLKTKQLVKNAKPVLVIDGTALILANKALGGMLNLSLMNTHGLTSDITTGDPVVIARALQQYGDSVGTMLSFAWMADGVVNSINFIGGMISELPPALMSGNDFPVYDTEYAYQSWNLG